MLMNSMLPFAVHSHAEPRPHAYHDDMGLERPYGLFRAFMPSVLGSNLRHYKPPKPRPVEI
jgi:hypothetical protein